MVNQTNFPQPKPPVKFDPLVFKSKLSQLPDSHLSQLVTIAHTEMLKRAMEWVEQIIIRDKKGNEIRLVNPELQENAGTIFICEKGEKTLRLDKGS